MQNQKAQKNIKCSAYQFYRFFIRASNQSGSLAKNQAKVLAGLMAIYPKNPILQYRKKLLSLTGLNSSNLTMIITKLVDGGYIIKGEKKGNYNLPDNLLKIIDLVEAGKVITLEYNFLIKDETS